ncbi:MAG TPA: hypothetical protein PKL13_01890, partial [bacterium]|nr:hypothetical protein [bacterium]
MKKSDLCQIANLIDERLDIKFDEKLKNFATKDDLSKIDEKLNGFATKDDLSKIDEKLNGFA